MSLYANPLKAKQLLYFFPKNVWMNLLSKGLLERFQKNKVTISDAGVDYLLANYPSKCDEIKRVVARGRYEEPKSVDLSTLF